MSTPLSQVEAAILAEADPFTVDDRAPWLVEDSEDHKLLCSLRAGVETMRSLARECVYMWPNPGELEQLDLGSRSHGLAGRVAGGSFTLYDLRIERAYMPDVLVRSIQDFGRLPFRASVVFDGWSDELQGVVTKTANGRAEKTRGWRHNVDGTNLSFDEYAHQRFEDKLFEGVCYTFIDNHPGVFASPADRRKAKAWPRLYHFRRGDLRNFVIEERNGSSRIQQISFVMPIMLTDTSDRAAVKAVSVDGRKVVVAGDPMAPHGSEERLVRTYVYIKPPDGKEWIEVPERRGFIIPDTPGVEMLDIPLVPHYSIRECAWRGRSQFVDAAWIQSAIWNHNSERSGLAREAALAFVTRSGVPKRFDPTNNTPTLIDTRNARYFESEGQASTQIAEMSGSALQSIKLLIDEQKADIRSIVHQIFSERPTGPVTATEITMEGVHASSELEMQVVFEEHAWQRIAEIVSLLAGWPQVGTVTIPHDFGLPAADLDRNDSLYMANKMSPEAYWKERIRAGSVGEDFDLKAEIAWAETAAKREAGSGIADAEEMETCETQNK